MKDISFPIYKSSPDDQKGVISDMHDRLGSFFSPPSIKSLPVLEELILTVLSQNTTDKNRDKAYNALRTAYPEWSDIADAKLEDLIEVLKPAGLAPQKAPRIQNIVSLARERDDLYMNFVKTMDQNEAESYLLALPGVGIKTAYCTMLFSCGMNVYPMDTHILRIFKRLSLIPPKPNVLNEHRRISSLIDEDCKKENHLNVIRLGKEVCKPRNPKCSICPISELCEFFSTQEEQEN